MDIYKLNYAYLLLFIAITAVKKYLEFIEIEPYRTVIYHQLTPVNPLNTERGSKTLNAITTQCRFVSSQGMVAILTVEEVRRRQSQLVVVNAKTIEITIDLSCLILHL